MNSIIEKVVIWSLGVIKTYGYVGIFSTMFLESAAIPIPSEVVLPFSGFLAFQGSLDLWTIIILATVANLCGATVLYLIGHRYGNRFLKRYGKFLFIHDSEIERLEGWLNKYGSVVVFFSRLMPGVRTFGSLVIGEAKISFKKFFIYTVAGSFVWNWFLAYVGYRAGENWDFLEPYFHKFQLLILAAIIIGIIIFIYRNVKKGNHRQLES